jgi:hypothetical protein
VQVPYGEGVGAAKLAVILAGESPANRGGPVAVVVISSNGKGDRPVESLEVKAPGGRRECRSDPYRGASNLAGRSECVNQVAPKFTSRVQRIAGSLGMPSRSIRGEGHADIAVLELTVIGFPGVVGDGMPGKNEQRKLGTTRGSPRRSRTAKASRISRHAVKSRCAREWGGWGRLSDDGPGQNNPDPSEGPWGRWSIPPHGGAVYRVDRSDSVRVNVEARRAKTNRS